MIFFQILRHGTEAEIKVQLCGDPRGGLGGHEQLFVAECLQTVQRVRDERAGKSLALRVAAYGNPMQPATGQLFIEKRRCGRNLLAVRVDDEEHSVGQNVFVLAVVALPCVHAFFKSRKLFRRFFNLNPRIAVAGGVGCERIPRGQIVMRNFRFRRHGHEQMVVFQTAVVII